MAASRPKDTGGLILEPSTASTPFTAEETQLLLGSDLSKLMRDSAVARLVLSRYNATVATHRAETAQLRRELEHALARAQLSASPLTTAVLSLSSLRPEERPQVFTAHAGNLLEAAREAASLAHQERLAAGQALKRALLTLEQLTTLDLPAQAASELAAALTQLRSVVHALARTTSLLVVDQVDQAVEEAGAEAFVSDLPASP